MKQLLNHLGSFEYRESFIRQLRLTSIPPYLNWSLGQRRHPVQLRLRSGFQMILRPREGLTNHDYGVAYEVFVHEFYRAPKELDPSSVRLIVDLGANAGFSCLYLLANYRQAELIAFEPHPKQAQQCRRHLEINNLSGRARLCAAAAGAQSGRMRLSDAGASSGLTMSSEAHFDVDVVDIFPLLSGRVVDILKIDIEGGEYSIFEDERFNKLNARAIVMEWHQRRGRDNDGEWCADRLRQLGYTVAPIFEQKTHGMFWALRLI